MPSVRVEKLVNIFLKEQNIKFSESLTDFLV